jgi:hypothetical protein
MLLPEKMKEILASKGRDLKAIGLNEIALAKHDAIDAVRSLEGSQMAILGGDVYYEKGGRMLPAYDNWYCNPQSNENPLAFAKRSQTVALDFLENHRADGTTFYVLVLAELGVAGPKTNE